MQSVKNRIIDKSKPVKVYWNLHRNCYSVQQNGLVVGHTDSIELRDVTFKVSEAGRQRVLKERKKNVHAFVTGYLYDGKEERNYDISIVYNPYKYDSFRLRYSDRVAVLTADFVSLQSENGKGSILADRDVESYVTFLQSA
jgi:hypothetical protein